MSRHLGLDLGGTNIKIALVAQDGSSYETLASDSLPTHAELGPAAVTSRLLVAARRAIGAWGPVDGVGVGVPGLFDADDGRVVLLPNLPGPWAGHPLRDELAAGLGLPVALINDARAFTLAETRLGAAAGASTVLCLVLGTGVGGGVVVDGRLRAGRHGRAGEVGHQVLVVDGAPCGCGNQGCLEAYASAAALSRLGGRATPADVVAAARAGDERALAALREVAGHLAVGVANVVTVLVPERIVVGGGVAAAGELLLGPLRREVGRRAVLVPTDWYEVVPAVLGPIAGAVGAALWSREGSAGWRAGGGVEGVADRVPTGQLRREVPDPGEGGVLAKGGALDTQP